MAKTDAEPMLAITSEQLSALLESAVKAALQATPQGTDIGAQMAQALRQNRDRIPENTDAEYHGRSHYHPAGLDAPRPELTVETWCGKWEHETQKATPLWPYEPTALRDDEIETINTLEPGQYPMERKDGVPVTLYVVDQKNAQGDVYRRVIAYPEQLFQKEHANQVPDLKSVRRQVLAA